MKDRRPVAELSIEELEEVLRLRKREARLERIREQRGQPEGREMLDPPPPVSVAGTLARPAVGNSASRYSAVVESRRSRTAPRGIQWRWIWDQLLLLLEITAVAALVVVIGMLLLTVRDLNEESLAAQVTPTVSPTPVIDAFVLPGGHTPPDARGEAQPEPIPAHLQHLVQAVTPQPAPPPGPEHPHRIVIPAIGVDAPVVQGDDWETLKKGAGHRIGSANPGARGNTVISAHNDIYGEIFRYLPDLKVGDEIFVHTTTQVYRYVIQQTRIIEPTEVSVMAPTSTPVLTLISCYPYRVDTHRIVVIAGLEF